jgi:hypothetical protein
MSNKELLISAIGAFIAVVVAEFFSSVSEKWVSDDCSYLCKGLIVLFFEFDVILACAPASWALHT